MSGQNYCRVNGCTSKVMDLSTKHNKACAKVCKLCFDELDECDKCFDLAMELNPLFCFNLNRRKLPKKNVINTSEGLKVGSYCSKCASVYKLKQVYTLLDVK